MLTADIPDLQRRLNSLEKFASQGLMTPDEMNRLQALSWMLNHPHSSIKSAALCFCNRLVACIAKRLVKERNLKT